MAERVTTEFAKMGRYPGPGEILNTSELPSPNTTLVRRSGNAKGGMAEAATAKRRTQTMERGGARLHPTTVLYAQNAAEASAMERHVYRVPSAVAPREFWTKRQYGQRTQ